MCQGSGLSEKQIEACDHFIYIPHYGGGTASLNVACAASIVLHRFAAWAQYRHRPVVADAFQYTPRAAELYHPLPNSARLQQAMGRKCEGQKPSPVAVAHGEAEVRFALPHSAVQ
jgi:tRNA C32,U32 (ribose-2'-O)-methylase TrmJ